jgi:transposase-like protein
MEDRLSALIEIASKVTDEHLAEITNYAACWLSEEATTQIVQSETIAIPDVALSSGNSEREHNSLLPCPHCGSTAVNHFGSKRGKPRFRCKVCKKTFVFTTNTVMYYSHQNAESWSATADDLVSGVPLRETAENLGISEYTAFRMRHKLLMALEQREPVGTVLQGECELDETYVLESHNGKNS